MTPSSHSATGMVSWPLRNSRVWRWIPTSTRYSQSLWVFCHTNSSSKHWMQCLRSVGKPDDTGIYTTFVVTTSSLIQISPSPSTSSLHVASSRRSPPLTSGSLSESGPPRQRTAPSTSTAAVSDRGMMEAYLVQRVLEPVRDWPGKRHRSVQAIRRSWGSSGRHKQFLMRRGKVGFSGRGKLRWRMSGRTRRDWLMGGFLRILPTISSLIFAVEDGLFSWWLRHDSIRSFPTLIAFVFPPPSRCQRLYFCVPEYHESSIYNLLYSKFMSILRIISDG